MRLLEKDKKQLVMCKGKEKTVGAIYKESIERFNTWWNNSIKEFKEQKKVVYQYGDNIKLPGDKIKPKYIIELELEEYKKFIKRYKTLITQCTNAIPQEYQYALNIEKNVEYLNTDSYTLSIKDAYTRTKSQATKGEIFTYILFYVQRNMLSQIEDKETKEEKEVFWENEIEKQLMKLPPHAKYYVKEVSAKQFRVNYYSLDENKSSQKGLGDIVFVPPGAHRIDSKRQKKRKDTKVPIKVIRVEGKEFNIYVHE